MATKTRREWATTTGDDEGEPRPPDGDGWDLRGVYCVTDPSLTRTCTVPDTWVRWCWQRDVAVETGDQ